MELYFSKALPDVEAIVQSKAWFQILAGACGLPESCFFKFPNFFLGLLEDLQYDSWMDF